MLNAAQFTSQGLGSRFSGFRVSGCRVEDLVDAVSI